MKNLVVEVHWDPSTILLNSVGGGTAMIEEEEEVGGGGGGCAEAAAAAAAAAGFLCDARMCLCSECECRYVRKHWLQTNFPGGGRRGSGERGPAVFRGGVLLLLLLSVLSITRPLRPSARPSSGCRPDSSPAPRRSPCAPSPGECASSAGRRTSVRRRSTADRASPAAGRWRPPPLDAAKAALSSPLVRIIASTSAWSAIMCAFSHFTDLKRRSQSWQLSLKEGQQAVAGVSHRVQSVQLCLSVT
ncbi:hypothetical protein TYRP_011750 [Tyrophagus putrescentiae]|nr:hypothetical protein TYRP_011750 [Tyrophagus putrescentiae]